MMVTGSDEELSSLKEAYLSSKGNMQHVIDSVMCASVEDEERFKKLLEPLVKSKELPSYKKFFKEPAASKKKRHSKVCSFFNMIDYMLWIRFQSGLFVFSTIHFCFKFTKVRVVTD